MKFSRYLLMARYWLEARLVLGILALLKLLPARRSIEVMAWLCAKIGPRIGRQRKVMNNLEAAFPEKSLAEREEIARNMWANMGRMIAEYVYLDQLYDFDPNAEKPGLIEVDGVDLFVKLHENKSPCIFFTGHTGNFELLPVAAATYDLEVTALFRPPNNPFIAKKVLSARTTNMGHLVPSKAGAAWALAKALENGKAIGVLVDQKAPRGRYGTFFDRPVQTNPLLPKLARQFNVPIYPTRCVRLPGGRFRLELEDELILPKTADGDIDVDASCQVLNDVVERWVRQYPDQWMWMHRRWELAPEHAMRKAKKQRK